MSSGSLIADGMHNIFNLYLESPEAIKGAVHASVRCSRLARLAGKRTGTKSAAHVDHCLLDVVDPDSTHPLLAEHPRPPDVPPRLLSGGKRTLLHTGWVSLAGTYAAVIRGNAQKRLKIHWNSDMSAALVSFLSGSQ